MGHLTRVSRRIAQAGVSHIPLKLAAATLSSGLLRSYLHARAQIKFMIAYVTAPESIVSHLIVTMGIYLTRNKHIHRFYQYLFEIQLKNSEVMP